jgi:cell pole-organizing protein PopZ
VDPKVAANVSSELDVQMRGEDAVNADIAAVEKENAKLEKAAKQAAKAKAKKDEKPAEPESVAEPEKPVNPEGEQGQPVPQPEEPVAQEPETEEAKDGQGTVETTDNGSQDARGESDSELPVDGPRAESAQ